MISVKDFLEAEKSKMSWLDKVVMNYPQVYQTSFLSPPIKQHKSEIVIRPSLFTKLIAVSFLLFALVFYIPLFNVLRSRTLPIPVPVTGILFISFILYLLIWHSFLNPKYIYHIRLSSQCIEARKNKFYWNEIAETCILTRMEGRFSNSYLVLLMRDGRIEKMDLFKFSISNKRLSGIVEFFKEQNEFTTTVLQ